MPKGTAELFWITSRDTIRNTSPSQRRRQGRHFTTAEMVLLKLTSTLQRAPGAPLCLMNNCCKRQGHGELQMMSKMLFGHKSSSLKVALIHLQLAT